MNILTEKEIQEILKISAKKTHALMRANVFPVIKIGTEYRVIEDKFMEWINGGNCRIDKLKY